MNNSLWDTIGRIGMMIAVCALVFGIGQDIRYLLLVPAGIAVSVIGIRQDNRLRARRRLFR